MYRVTVEPVVLLYAFSYTIQLSVQQDFIFSKLCNEHYPQEVCEASWEASVADELRWVQGEAVKYVMIMSVITSLVGTVSSQFFGAALDRCSQKTVMVAPFAGAVGLHVVCVVVASLPSLSLTYLFLGAFLAGLTGGYAVFKSSVSSYVVRSVDESARTSRLALVEGMVLLGCGLGPLLLQQCLTSFSSSIPHKYLFLGSEGVIVAATLYIIIILPDLPAPKQLASTKTTCTVAPSSDPPASPTSTGCCALLRETLTEFTSAFSVTLRKRSAGRRTAILLLLVADFFIAIVFAAEFDLLYLYMQDQLGFTLVQYSRYLVLKNVVNGVSLLFVLPGLRRSLGISDLMLGVVGGLSRAVAFTMLALNRSHYLVFIVPFLDVFGQYLFVVLRSRLASLVDTDEQGRQLTVTASLAQLSLLAGSLLFDNVYPALLDISQPGFTFLLAAAIMVLATCILAYTQHHLTRANNVEETRPLLQ